MKVELYVAFYFSTLLKTRSLIALYFLQQNIFMYSFPVRY